MPVEYRDYTFKITFIFVLKVLNFFQNAKNILKICNLQESFQKVNTLTVIFTNRLIFIWDMNTSKFFIFSEYNWDFRALVFHCIKYIIFIAQHNYVVSTWTINWKVLNMHTCWIWNQISNEGVVHWASSSFYFWADIYYQKNVKITKKNYNVNTVF